MDGDKRTREEEEEEKDDDDEEQDGGGGGEGVIGTERRENSYTVIGYIV